MPGPMNNIEPQCVSAAHEQIPHHATPETSHSAKNARGPGRDTARLHSAMPSGTSHASPAGVTMPGPAA
jgi:hypothetical protein